MIDVKLLMIIDKLKSSHTGVYHRQFHAMRTNTDGAIARYLFQVVGLSENPMVNQTANVSSHNIHRQCVKLIVHWRLVQCLSCVMYGRYISTKFSSE